MNPLLQSAAAALDRGAVIAVCGEGAIAVSGKHGVLPILDWLNDGKNTLKGAYVADKVVGKAAAMLLALGGAAEIYGGVMSNAAAEFLAARGIPFSCGKRVPRITNREGTGPCPMEACCLPLTLPEEAYRAICEKIRYRPEP